MVRKNSEAQQPLPKLNQEMVLQDSNDAIITHDLDGMITAWNRGPEMMNGYNIEKVLRERDGLLTNLYEYMNEPVFYLDIEAEEQYRFQSVNPAFLNATGLEASQVIGKFVSEVIPEPSLSLVLPNYRTAVQNRERVCWEATISYPAGNRTVSVAINPIMDRQGVCTSLLGIVYDITERKQVEQILRAEDEKFRVIFDTTGTTGLIIEEDTTISLVNRECEILTGYTKKEIEGRKSWKELIRKAHLDEVAGYHNLRRIDPYAAPKRYETEIMAKNGHVKQVVVTASMSPGMKQSIVFLLDISGIKQAERDVEQSENKFRTLFEEAPEGIAIARAGQTLMGNRAYLNMFGYADITELEGIRTLGHIAPQCRSQVKEESAKIRALAGGVHAFETVGMRKDGSQFPVFIEGTHIELLDGPAILGYFEDITLHKQAELQLKARAV